MPDDVSSRNTDFDDLNRELAGISGSRAERFLGDIDGVEGARNNKRQSRDKALKTQLDLLMIDPAYAEAFSDANQAIDDVQDILNSRRQLAADNIERLLQRVDGMEDRTAKLENGTAVFRDEKGRFVTSDGRRLTDTEIALLINPHDALAYDPYADTRDALNDARSRQNKYDGYQDRIDTARQQMKGAPDRETIDDVQRDMDELRKEIELENRIAPNFEAVTAPSFDREDSSAEVNFSAVDLTR